MFDQIEAFFSLVERFKKYSAAKSKTDSLPSRFVSLFANHAIHRNQIPRFFGHNLTLADMSSDDTYIAKMTVSLIGIEACGGAHYWAREFKKLGHEVV